MTSTITDRFDVAPEEGIKAPARMASLANLTLSGLQTIDGVVGAEYDRVLVKDQTDATENGLYTMRAGAWTRTPDWDDSTDIAPGVLVAASEGTQTGLVYQAAYSGPYAPGATALTFLVNGAVSGSEAIQFDNVAALVGATALASGQIVETKGYTTPGDGGGARYLIKTAAEFGGTPDGYGDLALANGNVAVLQTGGVANLRQFGCPGDGSDQTLPMQAAFDKDLLVVALDGTYSFSALTGLSKQKLRVLGQSMLGTVFKHTGTGIGIDIDGAIGGVFLQGGRCENFTVEGNPNTTNIIRKRKTARDNWINVNVREANPTTGIGILLQGSQLSRYENVFCSQDLNAMTSAPSEGIRLEATAGDGNSSNNTFDTCYFEGAGQVSNSIGIGIRILGGTQNTFIGGSAESCKTWGLLVGTGCNYNSFMGVGFENLNATGGDVGDAGRQSLYENCYSSENFILQGDQARVDGGFFERIQVDGGATRNRVHNALVNNWATGSGGLVDNGTGTETKSVYDIDAASYLTNIYPRFLATRLSTLSNVTGNGTEYQVPFDEIFDDNNNHNAGAFTAPVDGRYELSTTLSLDGLTTAATLVSLKIVTSNRTYLTEKSVNPKVGGTQESISMSVVADMDALDTAHVTIKVSGEASDVVDIIGNATTMWSAFSGHKIN